MMYAVVKDNLVENVIVAEEAQKAELEAALQCELVDARPYGLAIGDLRMSRGWTRNAGGEQMLLEEQEPEQYDSYTVAMNRAITAERQAEVAQEQAAAAQQRMAQIMALVGSADTLDKAAVLSLRKVLGSVAAAQAETADVKASAE